MKPIEEYKKTEIGQQSVIVENWKRESCGKLFPSPWEDADGETKAALGRGVGGRFENTVGVCVDLGWSRKTR